MATVSEIFAEAASILGDKLFYSTTKTDMARFANAAQDIISTRTTCLQKEYYFALVKGEPEYSLPSDCIKVLGVTYRNSMRLQHRSFYDFNTNDSYDRDSYNQPYSFVITQDKTGSRKIRIQPRPSSSSLTFASSGAIDSDDVTIATTASATTVPKFGRLKIDSEIIEFIDNSESDGTYGFTISSGGRGAQSTTAASHADESTITFLDMGIRYTYIPTRISHLSTSVTPDIPSEYHNLIVYYIVSQGAARRDSGLSNKYLQMFNNGVDQMILNVAPYSLDVNTEANNIDNAVIGDLIQGYPLEFC